MAKPREVERRANVSAESTADRIRAIAVAAHGGDPGPAEAARSDDDPLVRVAALGALDRCGALDDATLRDALGDPAPRVRRRACELAARHPDASVLAALADDDPLVAEAAAWALGEHAAAVAPGSVAALADVVKRHPEALVREAAAAALGAIGDPAGLPAILAAVRDVVTVRRRAVLALAPFEGPDVVAALEQAAGDRDWQVRNAANDLLPFVTAPEDEHP
ncbi:MAG: HEAT repeat domain-containing protein [Acidimicrobiales bacterium]